MATIEEIKQQYPDLNGLDDDQVVGALHKAFYADLPRELVAKSLGVKPQPVIDKNAPGQMRSGFNRAFAEVPGLAAGSAAYVADVVGADETRDKLLDYAKKSSEEVQAAHQGDAASITDAWDGKTSWSDFLKNATGYVAGQALQGIATGGLGALGGKMLATQGIKTAAERAAAEFIAKGATQEVATAAAATAAKSYAAKMAVRGAVVGAGGQNLNMELGSIYPDAVDEATSQGRTLDGGDKFRVGASALAAAGVDTAAEAITANRVFRGSRIGQGATKPPTVLGSEILGRAVREVPAGMVREGGTEGVQTAIEHYGAGQPIADEKGTRDIVDSMGVGAVGGILGGAGASFHARKVEEVGPLSRAANADIDTADQPTASPALQIGNTPDPYLSFADGTVARKSEIDTYINSLPPEQQPAARAKVMGLAPQPSIPQAEPVTPAQAMGIDPAAGPLSNAAAIAVNTGTTQEIQRNQASEADQAAYDEATAVQEQQAAQQAQQQDSAINPIASGPIAEATMSPEDKRAILFSNQPVTDGGVRYTGTQDGDILNGLGKPYATRMAAQRRVSMEGKDWMVAPVFDGFVARRKDALNGTTDATAAVDQGADAGAGHQPTGSGTNSLAEPVPGTDGAGSLPAASDGRGEPDHAVVDAGHGAAAIAEASHVQDPTPAAQPAPVQATGTTPPAVAGDAAATEGLPAAASAAVEAAGVDQTQVSQPAANAAQPPESPHGNTPQNPKQAQQVPNADAQAQSLSEPVAPKIAREIDKRAALAAPDPQNQGNNHAETTETQQVEPQQKAPERAAGKQVAPKLTARAKIAQAQQARADYFTPGNIVKGYAGYDKVLSYTPSKGDGNGWNVKVRAVVKQDGKWISDPKDNRDRNHSTQPDARELKAGPVERAAVPKVPEEIARPGRETVTPADDKNIGANAQDEPLHERKDGSVYRMHNGKPDFGGDLVPVEVAKSESKPAQQEAAKEVSAEPPAEPAKPSAQPAARAQVLVDAITARWKNAPKAVVVQSLDDPRVPEKDRKNGKLIESDMTAIKSNDSAGSPDGFFDKGTGTVYLIADKMAGDIDVVRVLMHESLGHYGLRGLYGAQLGTILDRIAVLNAAKVRNAAKRLGLDFEKPSERRLATEEVLSYMAQTTPELGWVKRAVAAVRAWMRQHIPGFGKMQLSDEELIRDYIIPARQFVEDGSHPEGKSITGEDGTPFSRGANESMTNPDVVGNKGGRSAEIQVDGFSSFEGVTSKDGSTTYHGTAKVKGDTYFATVKVTHREDGSPRIGLTDYRFETMTGKSVRRSANTTLEALMERAKEAALKNESTAPESGGVFSRNLGDALTSAANNVRDVNLPAGYKVSDLINGAPGKLNWWHKSVGTQYNLAQRSAPFKKVYDSVQDFINDVSYYATEAADLAPTILPKLETLKDIGKSPLSAEDTKAVSAPVFEGTLTWGRDESGQPVKMDALEHNAANLSTEQKGNRLLRNNHISEGMLKMWQGLDINQYETLISNKYERDMLKPGVVWTPAELKSIFKLNDKQVGLYQEFRKATDKSLTNLAIADMLRFGGDDVIPLREAALDAKTPGEAATMLADYLRTLTDLNPQRREVLLDTADKMIEKGDKATELMARGYAPLSRFGQYTLDVVHNGERVYFGMFENKWEAAKMNRKMNGLFPGATINQGTVSEQAYKMFAGVSPETLELFGDMLGLEGSGDGAANAAFQTYLKLARSNRSAMKRLIQRKGIAGFSEDAGRVLAGFVYSNARQTASSLHMGDMTRAAADKEAFGHNGELQDAATKLVDYIKNPQEEAQAFRGLMFAQYIGGSVASAMVNLTQPVTMTFPWLAQYGSVAGAAKQMVSATKDANRKTTGDAALDAALHKAEEDGTVSPQEVHQLMQQAMGRGVLRSGDGTTAGNAMATAQNTLSRVGLAWGKMFSTAEQFNRRVTFIAAYRTAVQARMADPDAFARRAIAETQGVYNRGNKPQWARGALGSTLFTFKQYSISYVEMLSRMAKNGAQGRKAALLALAVMFVLSGASGLPGSDDLDDIISGALQAMGYNFDSKQKRKEFFVSLIGEGGADFMERGISGLPGVPVDVSGRLGIGNLIPGTGLLTKKTDHTRDVAEFAGVAGDFLTRGFDTASKIIKGDIGGVHGAVATMAPKAAQNLFQAYDMASTGMYRDAQGRKVLDTDAGDAISKAIGLQPNDVKRVQDAAGDAMRMIGLNRIRESEIAGEWAAGLFEKDQSKVQAARDDLKQWNIDNPDSPIKINFRQIIQRVHKMNESKIERIAKTSPKEIRASVKRELLASQ